MAVYSESDLRMVADRLGLTHADVPEIRWVLDAIDRAGFEAFVDETLAEAALTLEAAYAGDKPDAVTVRRAQVRKRLAEAFVDFIALRQVLADHNGPTH